MNGVPTDGAAVDDDVRSEFAYDHFGAMTGYCPPVQVVASCDEASAAESRAWRYAYDDAGRMIKQTPPDNATVTDLAITRWVYNVNGRLDDVVDETAAGTVLRHSTIAYDDLGRDTLTTLYQGAGTGTKRQDAETTYRADGSVAAQDLDRQWESPAQSVETAAYTYDSLGRLDTLALNGLTRTDLTWNADGTIASRIDHHPTTPSTPYTTTFPAYDWANRATTVRSTGSFAIYAGDATFSYRLDGLIGGRTWPNGETATFGYDGAKRPTSIGLTASKSFGQTYDRDGNVLSESRSLGFAGDNGAGTNTYTYDPLGRLTGESGLASSSYARTYEYDLDGNRTRKTEGPSSTQTFTFDRADQLIDQQIGGTAQDFAYDAYGNLTASVDQAGGTQAYAYDLASRLRSLTVGASSATFSFDALGRIKTRTTSASETYAYLGSSETAWASATATSTRASVIGPDGSRIATKDGVTTAYLVPDPHGNVAATETASTAIANAIRYDGYGQTLGTPYQAAGAITLDTKYQGRLDLSPSPAFPVYEFSARNMSPTLGTFTSLDTYAGSAQDPASMNRFLYAQANPTTLIDPTGHDACVGAECDTPTYDDRSEGLDLCVRSCQDSTTEYGKGDAGYTGGAKPPPNYSITPIDERSTPNPQATPEPYAPGLIDVILTTDSARFWTLPRKIAEFPPEILADVQAVKDQIRYYMLNGEYDKADRLSQRLSSSYPNAYITENALRTGDFFGLAMAAGVVGITGDGFGGGPGSAAGARGPNPGGSLGGPDHRSVVGQAEADIASRGLVPVREYPIQTPGGLKGSRRADVAAFDEGDTDLMNPLEIHQVGVQTKGGLPVSRERQAFDDIMTSSRVGKDTTYTYWPYRSR